MKTTYLYFLEWLPFVVNDVIFGGWIVPLFFICFYEVKFSYRYAQGQFDPKLDVEIQGRRDLFTTYGSMDGGTAKVTFTRLRNTQDDRDVTLTFDRHLLFARGERNGNYPSRHTFRAASDIFLFNCGELLSSTLGLILSFCPVLCHNFTDRSGRYQVWNTNYINIHVRICDNSNLPLLCLFWAIWLAVEKVLHVDKFHEHESQTIVSKMCITAKFSDRYAWTNSADPDQSAPRGAVWSGSTLFAIPSASFGLITLW